jgi:osmotically-inducible protein OsmY
MMKPMVCGVCLLLCSMALGQRPGQPPRTTPSTFPETKGTAQKQEKDAAQLEKERLKIEQEIEKTIRSDRRLRGASVKATVNEKNVVVSGTVKDDAQRRLALHMAEAYADGREIIDKLAVGGKT